MNELQDSMQPQMGQDTVSLPITFDYKGGRAESGRTRKVLSWIVGVVVFLLGLVILFGGGRQSLFVKLLVVSAMYTVTTYVIRFLFLQEGKLRKQYYEQLDKDYQLSYEDIWGIYDIDGEDIRTAHYRNGQIGMFFTLEKDVIVGLDAKAEFDHYEAIADAYNEAAKHRARLIHLDYMTHVGKDSRISNLYAQAAKSENPELRAVLNGMYSHLEDSMQDEISTFDAYVVLVSSTESQYVSIARSIIGKLMEGNYLGYSSLDDFQLRNLMMELFNLHTFSVVEAQRSALVSSTLSVAVPITIERNGVVTKLNKTVAEKQKEAEDERKLQELVKREQRRRRQEEKSSRKKGKKTKKVEDKKDDEVINLWE